MNIMLSNFLLLMNLTFFSKHLLKSKGINKYIRYIALALGIILLTFKNYTSASLVGTMIMMLYFVFYVFVFFEGVIFNKIIVIILFSLTIAFTELFVANFMSYFLGLRSENINSPLYTMALINSNILNFIVLFFLSKSIKIDVVISYTKTMWLSLILPMTTLLFLFNFTDYFNTFRDNQLTLIIILGLVVSNVIFLHAISKDMKQKELNNEIKKARMKYEILNTLYDSNFHFLHDTIRTLTRLITHINKDNYHEFQKEVKDLNDTLERSFNTITSSYEVLNTLINYRIADINENNIKIKSVIELTNFDFLTLDDQQALFSELLTISIDSCAFTGKDATRIIFKAKKIDRQISLQCSFSYDKSHAINCDNLYKIVNKYNGNLSEVITEIKEYTYYEIFIVFKG